MKAMLIPTAALVVACTGSSSNSWRMPSLPKGAPTPSWAARGGADAVDVDEGGEPDPNARPARSGIWLSDEAAAWNEAKRRGQPLLVDFSADWCSACMRLKEGTLSDEAVQVEIARDFVPLRIDVTEESQGGREQLRRFGIRGLPALLLLDPSGRELGRVDRYLDAEDFLAWLGATARGSVRAASKARANSASSSAASGSAAEQAAHFGAPSRD